MHYLDLTLATAAENLAMDEALLLAAEAGDGGEVLRLWEWPLPAVVLGSGCQRAAEVNLAACAADDVPVLRRASGGGTVLLGPGCLLYTLVLSTARASALSEIRSSYEYILTRIAKALGPAAAGAAVCGISDLALGERKFSGNAQQRKRQHILHHGTLLYAFDVATVGRYLHPPPRQPAYRAGRDHAEFLCNLQLSRDELTACLRNAWAADETVESWPTGETARLTEEKYTSRTWTERR